MISRREFLNTAASFGVASLCARTAAGFGPWDSPRDLVRSAPKARYWISTASPDSDCSQCHAPASVRGLWHQGRKPVVKCLLCAQGCVIPKGDRGKCRARMNVDGELRSLVYGRPVAVHVDPIEKKPFYHFLPGSEALSFASSGCPLRCKFCQNWEISQSRPEDFDTGYVPPEEMADSALSKRVPVVAFTYNEPTVFFEYLTDVARAARARKLRSVLVSCGFMNSQPLGEMCQVLDAIKIDLKGFSEDFYREVCGAELRPVLGSIRQVAKSGIHLEIVNLVVPTLNDSESMVRDLADWIVGEAGPDVPVHFNRFHPDYRLQNLPPTPVAILERCRDIAMIRGVRYAYIGNVPNHPGNHTYCPQCGKAVIKRNSIFLAELNLEHGRCRFCGKSIPGVWA